MEEGWAVYFTRKSNKQLRNLPDKVLKILGALHWDLKQKGPVRGDWPNYSKLGPKRHHCHLNKKGRPTYVAVWEESESGLKIIEVTYVGSREKAPY